MWPLYFGNTKSLSAWGGRCDMQFYRTLSMDINTVEDMPFIKCFNGRTIDVKLSALCYIYASEHLPKRHLITKWSTGTSTLLVRGRCNDLLAIAINIYYSAR